MRDPTTPTPLPAATVVDAETIAEVKRSFRQQYDVLAWYGPFTGHWWAMVGPAHLVEAAQPRELERAIRRAWGWE
ncbi:hypothetical protein Acsp03_12940 [Actinomadura sp. NBRC 104412]|uniref:hypothetical protein n=1 Tax=Actinomadura sp. NBRC 104412 TaxID=3032203 RepID=UPI0024A59D21|nr:hypothetical protein [Actinomadura sp. NBRC 104412]GLZ03828.1 hypothetical protein Acsp03_12940 [Actinomadura sp. NBRC 104412]